MGARPSGFKKGGGFLNNKDVTLTGLQIVVESDVEIKNGKRAGETWSPIKLGLTFQEDGASDSVTTHLLIGDADREDYGDISDDGLSMEDPKELGLRDSEAGVFVTSLCDSALFPEDRFDADPKVINLAPMIGTRMRVVQEKNADKTKRQGQRKGKDGKLYDQQDLKVAEVYSVTPIKAGTKSKAVPAAEIDVQAAADEVIAAIVEKAGGKLGRDQLGAKLQVSKAKFKQFNGEWPTVAKMVLSVDYLVDAAERDIISYNAKTQTLTSAS